MQLRQQRRVDVAAGDVGDLPTGDAQLRQVWRAVGLAVEVLGDAEAVLAELAGHVEGIGRLSGGPIGKEMPPVEKAHLVVAVAGAHQALHEAGVAGRLAQGLDVIQVGEAVHGAQVDHQLLGGHGRADQGLRLIRHAQELRRHLGDARAIVGIRGAALDAQGAVDTLRGVGIYTHQRGTGLVQRAGAQQRQQPFGNLQRPPQVHGSPGGGTGGGYRTLGGS
jgi:hypothetical protein